jgi:hypothetical protein
MNSGSSAFIGSHGQSAVTTRVPDNDHGLDATHFLNRRVDVGLERNLPAAAKTLVGSDDDVRFGVRDAAGDGLRREAAKHDRMNRANAGASEHRVSRLGDHGQVDRDAIALLDAVSFQQIGEKSDATRKRPIGDVGGLRGIVAFPDDRRLVGALGEMPIDAIVSDVGDAVLEPFDRDVLGVERRVLDLGEGREPVDALTVLGPKAFRIAHRPLVHLLVLGRVDPGALRRFGWNVIGLVGHGAPPRAIGRARFRSRAKT